MKSIEVYLLTEEELNARQIIRGGNLNDAIHHLLPIQRINKADYIGVQWKDGTIEAVKDRFKLDPRKLQSILPIFHEYSDKEFKSPR